jgi:hypothetical protein
MFRSPGWGHRFRSRESVALLVWVLGWWFRSPGWGHRFRNRESVALLVWVFGGGTGDQNGDTDSETGNRWHFWYGSLVVVQEAGVGTPIPKPGIGGTFGVGLCWWYRRLGWGHRFFKPGIGGTFGVGLWWWYRRPGWGHRFRNRESVALWSFARRLGQLLANLACEIALRAARLVRRGGSVEEGVAWANSVFSDVLT